MYYVASGAVFKINEALNVDAPYMLALENGDVDFLIYKDFAHICKGTTPAGILTANRLSTIKTAHIDLGTYRQKVAREIAIIIDTPMHSAATVNVYLDSSETPIEVFAGTMVFEPGVVLPGVAVDKTLAKGENRIWLDLPRFTTIAVEIRLESGTVMPSSFSLKELRMKYHQTGPSV
jgi:hypothetical protein